MRDTATEASVVAVLSFLLGLLAVVAVDRYTERREEVRCVPITQSMKPDGPTVTLMCVDGVRLAVATTSRGGISVTQIGD